MAKKERSTRARSRARSARRAAPLHSSERGQGRKAQADRRLAATLDKHISQVIRHDPAIRRLTRAILRSQKQLRASVSEEAWRTYLRLEELVNFRHDRIVGKAIDRVAGQLCMAWVLPRCPRPGACQCDG
jgi:hypothetical protein